MTIVSAPSRLLSTAIRHTISSERTALQNRSDVIVTSVPSAMRNTDRRWCKARRRSSEERLRISRELHDIIGHSLGTIAVQAGVGRHLIDTEPGSAAEALDNIARISRDSLDEVRAVVAALRDEEPPYQPAPGLDDLPELIEGVRATGLTVELTLPDDLDAVPRQTGAAVYRITREALTNVLRHAGASKASVGLAILRRVKHSLAHHRGR